MYRNKKYKKGYDGQFKSYSRKTVEIIVTVFSPKILYFLIKKLVAVRFIFLFLYDIEMILLCIESRNKKKVAMNTSKVIQEKVPK